MIGPGLAHQDEDRAKAGGRHRWYIRNVSLSVVVTVAGSPVGNPGDFKMGDEIRCAS